MLSWINQLAAVLECLLALLASNFCGGDDCGAHLKELATRCQPALIIPNPRLEPNDDRVIELAVCMGYASHVQCLKAGQAYPLIMEGLAFYSRCDLTLILTPYPVGDSATAEWIVGDGGAGAGYGFPEKRLLSGPYSNDSSVTRLPPWLFTRIFMARLWAL